MKSFNQVVIVGLVFSLIFICVAQSRLFAVDSNAGAPLAMSAAVVSAS